MKNSKQDARPMRRVFPYIRGDMSIEKYLMTLLLAILRKSGDEIRLSAEDILSVDDEDRIIKSIDDKTRSIVLSCGPKYPDDTEIYEVRPQFAPLKEPSSKWPRSSPEATSQNRNPQRNPPPQIPRPLDTTDPETKRQLDEMPMATMQDYLTGTDNQPRSRVAVLDDLNLFLREQKINQRKRDIQEEREKPLRFREGVLPFRTIKTKTR
jgi:hypothetical protein